MLFFYFSLIYWVNNDHIWLSVFFTVPADICVHVSEYVSYYLRCEVGTVENPFKDVSTMLILCSGF